MSQAAEVVALADAVVAAINAQTFAALPSTPLGATRLYLPVAKPQDPNALRVIVVPHDHGGDVINRAHDREMNFTVDVGFIQKLAAPVDDPRTQAQVDLLMALVEQVGNFLIGTRFGNVVPLKLENDPLWDPRWLEMGEFLSALTVTYRDYRTVDQSNTLNLGPFSSAAIAVGPQGPQGPAGPAGTTDHSLLSHLDYASAGHTGFAGTAVANTFTKAPLAIVIDADGNKGLVVKRHSSGATANCVEVQDENGNVLVGIDPSGILLGPSGTFFVATSPGGTNLGLRIARADLLGRYIELIPDVNGTGPVIDANNTITYNQPLSLGGNNRRLQAVNSSNPLIIAANGQAVQLNVSDAATSTVTTYGVYQHNSSGTPVAGFGLALIIQLDTNGGSNRNAGAWGVDWTNPADVNRTSEYFLQLVNAGGGLSTVLKADWGGGGGSDMGLWLWDQAAASLVRVTRGVSDSGGAGFRVLRVAN